VISLRAYFLIINEFTKGQGHAVMGVGVGAGAGEVRARARARAYSRYSKTAFYRYLGIPFLYGIPVNSQE
jgi:hypothetical protein